MEKVRIKDIAELAGVSRMTVSQALSPRPGSSVRIAPETRKRIQMLAEKLHYRPNLAARQLSSGRSRVIGYLLDSYSYKNFMDTLRFSEEVLSKAGYRMLVGVFHDDMETMERQLDDFFSRGVDGVLCSSHTYLSFTLQTLALFERFRNKVFIQKPLAAESLSYVDQDERLGIQMLTERMIDSGRRNILLLNKPISDRNHYRRIESFCEVLRAHGVSDPEKQVILDPVAPTLSNADECNRLLDKILPRRPDGLIVYQDYSAILMINLLRQRSLRVPEDIAVLCQRKSAYCEINDPPITSAEYHFGEIGRLAAETMLTLLATPDSEEPPVIQHRVAPTLFVGRSG